MAIHTPCMRRFMPDSPIHRINPDDGLQITSALRSGKPRSQSGRDRRGRTTLHATHDAPLIKNTIKNNQLFMFPGALASVAASSSNAAIANACMFATRSLLPVSSVIERSMPGPATAKHVCPAA